MNIAKPRPSEICVKKALVEAGRKDKSIAPRSKITSRVNSKAKFFLNKPAAGRPLRDRNFQKSPVVMEEHSAHRLLASCLGGSQTQRSS